MERKKIGRRLRNRDERQTGCRYNEGGHGGRGDRRQRGNRGSSL